MKQEEKGICAMCGRERTTNYIRYPDLCIFCIKKIEYIDKINEKLARDIIQEVIKTKLKEGKWREVYWRDVK